MRAPDWMCEAVKAFGRQLNLSTFTLNDQGVAGLSFENGASLRLEYVGEALVMVVGLKAEPTPDALARLYMDVNPEAAHGEFVVRAAHLARVGELVYVTKLAEHDVNVSTLQAAFTELWERIERLRRAL
ncbi:MAG: hypothetical protein MJ249_03300 [Kiritimatiellae bacterium]|nr:hypothetical protein [Kiritimatiellia bacterium]